MGYKKQLLHGIVHLSQDVPVFAKLGIAFLCENY